MEYQSPKSRCSLCDSEFTRQGLTRHIKSCLTKHLQKPSKAKPRNLIYLNINDTFNPDYFLHLLITRNAQPLIPCDECGVKPAVRICTECQWNEKGWLCEACSQTHGCDEEMFLPAVNSPRTGVCGYTGDW